MKLFHFPEDQKEIANVVEKSELASLMVPFVTESAVREACYQAVKYGMASVLAVPDICPQTVKLLAGTKVSPVCILSAMEIGDHDRATRYHCIEQLIQLGVSQVDIGVPIGMVLDEEYAELTDEIRDLAKLLHRSDGKLGIILEISQFTRPQLFGLCRGAVDGGADYLRISSGMEAIGAMDIGRPTIHNVAMLFEHFGSSIQIKAGGGWDYSYLEDCNEYLNSGAALADAGPCMIRQLEQMGYERRNKV